MSLPDALPMSRMRVIYCIRQRLDAEVRALILKGVVVLSGIVGVLATVRDLPAGTPRHFSSPLGAGTLLHVGIVVKDIAKTSRISSVSRSKSTVHVTGALTRFNRWSGSRKRNGVR